MTFGRMPARIVGGGGALLFGGRDVELALLGIGLDFRVGDGGEARGLEEAVDRLLGGADARALLFLAGIGRADGDALHGEREPARRREGLGALVDETLGDQRVGDGFAQILGRLALEAGGDFLGEEFEQQVGHGSPG